MNARSKSHLAHVIFVTLCVLCPGVHAAAPVVEYLFPAGAQQGTTLPLTAGSKFDLWPAKAWTDTPGLVIEPTEKVGEFIAKIAKDCPVGSHLVRIYNEQGASAPRIFIVDRHPEVLEKEPNDSFEGAQPIDKLPTIVNGQLEKPGDDDCFAITAEAGQWIVAELTCRRLGSMIDPAMHLVGPDGIEVAFNHDTFGLDPLIAWRVKKPGRHVIQVAGFQYPPGVDVRFAGSKAAVYRLLLTTGPYARYAFPAGAQRDIKTSLHLHGWNLGTSGEAIVFDFDASLPPRIDSFRLAPPVIHNTVRLAVSDVPEKLEVEPNDSLDVAMPIEVPSIINGRIDRPGDVDRYRFTASKGERFNFAVQSAALDFPLDAVLNIEDKTGNAIATVDDVGAAQDPRIDWLAPADGTFFVSISDRYNKGGPEYVYRLEAQHPQQDFLASSDLSAVRLEPGTSAELQITVTRQNNDTHPLAVVLDGLPAGVNANAGAVPPGGGAVKILLTAPANAPAFNGPMHATVVSLDPDHPAARRANFSIGADQLIPVTDTLWLTVTPPAPTTKPTK